MVYTILASICQHPIRTSSSLPWSGSNLDFDVRYCSDLCARGLPTRTEHRAAESEYETQKSRYDRRSIDRPEYKVSRRRFDNSRAALADFNDEYEERDKKEKREKGQVEVRSRDDPVWTAFQQQVNPRHGQRARFEDEPSHRRESQYREQRDYRRSSRAYDPGRYRDRSGSGFYDTSKPPADRPSARSRSPTRRDSRVSTGTRRASTRSDAYLDELDDEELEERRRAVERALASYKKNILKTQKPKTAVLSSRISTSHPNLPSPTSSAGPVEGTAENKAVRKETPVDKQNHPSTGRGGRGPPDDNDERWVTDIQRLDDSNMNIRELTMLASDRTMMSTETLESLMDKTDELNLRVRADSAYMRRTLQQERDSFSEQLLSSLTLIVGFLVIAAFPLLTQDFSASSFKPQHFSAETVRTFAAISVGLFITVILLCQSTKLLLDGWLQSGPGDSASKSSTPTATWRLKHVFGWRSLLLVVLLELLAMAILFFLLSMAAFAWVPGMIFVGVDSLFALTALSFWLLGIGVEGGQKLKQSSSPAQGRGSSTGHATDSLP